MSRHPVTPALEGDLRELLALQTRKRIVSFDVLKLDLHFAAAAAALNRLKEEGADVVLFDAIDEDDVARIGELLEKRATGGRPLFSVGPSSVEVALGARWRRRAKAVRGRPRMATGTAMPLLVGSGSCSAVTEQQISWALGHGFAGVEIDTASALRSDELPAPDVAAAASTVRHLRAGRGVILHTSRGVSDPRVAAAREIGLQRGVAQEQMTSRLGCVLGLTMWRILGEVSLPRVAVAGGDSSSYSARALGVEALEMIARLTPGGPLCRARAPGSPVDGCEIVFKGGQVGGRDYFGLLASGRQNPNRS